MKLFIIPNNEDCKNFMEELKSNNEVEIIELMEKDNQWYWENTPFPFPVNRGFPILYLGDLNDKPNLIIGKKPALEFIEKKYIYVADGHQCPYLNRICQEKTCVKFTILFKGLVPEGACADYWQPILMTEMLSKIKLLEVNNA